MSASSIIKNGDGNTLILTALIAAAVANALPTIADGFYFSKQQKLKQQLEDNQISVEKFWQQDILHYYTYTAAWYLLLVLIVWAFHLKFETNWKILLVLIAGGLVFAVYKKNVQKDKELIELRKQQANKNKQNESNFVGTAVCRENEYNAEEKEFRDAIMRMIHNSK